MLKKLLSIGLTTLMLLPMCAFIHTDLGINLKDVNNKTMVFKEVVIEESKINDISFNEAIKITSEAASNQNIWTTTEIEKYFDGKRHVGIRYDTEPRTNDYTEIYLWNAANADADYIYRKKPGIGSKTVTIRIKPLVSENQQYFSSIISYGKEEDDEYNFVIIAPKKVLSTNGVIQNDGKTVKWDIKDAINNKQEVLLTVKYRDPLSLILFILAIIVVGAIIAAPILKNRNRIEVDDDETFPRPAVNDYPDNGFSDNYQDNGFPGSNYQDNVFSGNTSDNEKPVDNSRLYAPSSLTKCPECGGPLVDNNTYCENCGQFF